MFTIWWVATSGVWFGILLAVGLLLWCDAWLWLVCWFGSVVCWLVCLRVLVLIRFG